MGIIRIIFLLLCLCVPVSTHAGSVRLFEWNFNDATSIDSDGGDVPDTDGCGVAIYDATDPLQTADPSPEGGQYIRSFPGSTTGGSQPMFWYSWGTSQEELFITFYMKLHSNLNDCPCVEGDYNEMESIKLFRVKDSWAEVGSDDYTINMYFDPNDEWHIYHTNADGTWSGDGYHDGPQWDEWHKYEIYTKYDNPPEADNGVLKIWVDDVLKWSLTDVDFRDSTDFDMKSIGLVYHAKCTFGPCYDANENSCCMDGYLSFDDVEVWTCDTYGGCSDLSDGAPTGTAENVTGVTISGCTVN